MRALSYTIAASAEAAVAQFAEARGSARYIAGGTNLYDLMKLGIEDPAHLIDVSRIDGMDAIETDGDVLRFGGRALMADVAYAPVVRDQYPVLSESLLKAASQQLRNMATVGGNLCNAPAACTFATARDRLRWLAFILATSVSLAPVARPSADSIALMLFLAQVRLAPRWRLATGRSR